MSVIVGSWIPEVLTSRISKGFRFLAVRGVLPRNLPGVLNISVTLLFRSQQALHVSRRSPIHLTAAENLRHMFVQPFYLVAG